MTRLKKIAIKLALLALVLFVSVSIFKTQVDIKKAKEESDRLASEIELKTDELSYKSGTLEKVKSKDPQTMKELARDHGYYDSSEEIIINDITD